MVTSSAHPPETLEGWYALHQVWGLAGGGSDENDTLSVDDVAKRISAALPPAAEGWSAAARLIGSLDDIMVMHFRPTLDAIAEAQAAFDREAAAHGLALVYCFLSVTEAGLYHLTAKMAEEAQQRGGSVGDDTWRAQVAERSAAERESDHVKRRLYPPLPADMPYVCFYPMSKRRNPDQNWYALTLEERSRLMHSHGMTGRRYAGRVQQIISGAIGFENWEWGVTLFARDPLDFKKLVTDMRFDEVSARYAEFGDFRVGKMVEG